MHKDMLRGSGIGVGIAAAIALLWLANVASQPESAPYRAPHFPGTEHPDLTGIWQAVNSANWDLQAHSASAGPHHKLIGAWGAQPAGASVVEGNEIPYKPEALKKRDANLGNRTTVDM